MHKFTKNNAQKWQWKAQFFQQNPRYTLYQILVKKTIQQNHSILWTWLTSLTFSGENSSWFYNSRPCVLIFSDLPCILASHLASNIHAAIRCTTGYCTKLYTHSGPNKYSGDFKIKRPPKLEMKSQNRNCKHHKRCICIACSHIWCTYSCISVLYSCWHNQVCDEKMILSSEISDRWVTIRRWCTALSRQEEAEDYSISHVCAF